MTGGRPATCSAHRARQHSPPTRAPALLSKYGFIVIREVGIDHCVDVCSGQQRRSLLHSGDDCGSGSTSNTSSAARAAQPVGGERCCDMRCERRLVDHHAAAERDEDCVVLVLWLWLGLR